jgi:hypothetical protein
MPAPLIENYTAYLAGGSCAVVVCPTIADFNAPTDAELSAGLNVTRQTSEIDGWNLSAQLTDRPDYASTQMKKIPGQREAADSSLLVYAKKTGLDLRQTLVLGYTGFVVLMPGGWVTGYKMDVFAVQVAARPKQWSITDPLSIRYEFALGDVAEDVAIPAP